MLSFGDVLNDDRDPPVAGIERLLGIAQVTVGITTHLRNLFWTYPLDLYQASGRVCAVRRQFPVAIRLRIGIGPGVSVAFN